MHAGVALGSFLINRILILIGDMHLSQTSGVQLRLACGRIKRASEHDADQEQQCKKRTKARVEGEHSAPIAAPLHRVHAQIETAPPACPQSGVGFEREIRQRALQKAQGIGYSR